MAEISVLMVTASFHPYIGGAERQALELSVALRARGVKVRVATRRLTGTAAREEVCGIPINRLWCLGSGVINALTFMISLTGHLIKEAGSYQVIHVHLAASPALPAVVIGRLLRKRVFLKLGGGRGVGELAQSAGSLTGRLKLKLLSWLQPQFIAVTRDLSRETALFLGPVPLHVMSNGVDTDHYRPVLAVEKQALRARLGWPAGIGFIYAGRLSPEKRLPQFLEIWAELAKKSRVQTFMAFVGDGPEASGLRESASSLRIQDRIFFHGPVDDVSSFYAAADIFILPSVSEGLSNALLEAMASGLAVLASRVGGTVEAVEEARHGFLFDPQDSAEINHQIQKFLDHPQLAGNLGRAGRQAAQTRYSLVKIAESYENLYRWGLP